MRAEIMVGYVGTADVVTETHRVTLRERLETVVSQREKDRLRR